MLPCFWPAAKAAFYEVYNTYVDAQAQAIGSSADNDWARWASTSHVNGDESLGYQAAVNKLKSNLRRRIDQMENEVANMMPE